MNFPEIPQRTRYKLPKEHRRDFSGVRFLVMFIVSSMVLVWLVVTAANLINGAGP